VPSTVIDTIDYNLETGALTIKYISGQTYRYEGVPEKVFKELKASRLKGRYLRFHVKDIYRFEKIER